MRLRLIAYMTILFVFSAGCTLISTSVKIHDFERSEITIPMSITVIENGKVFDTDYFVTRPTFVAHFLRRTALTVKSRTLLIIILFWHWRKSILLMFC